MVNMSKRSGIDYFFDGFSLIKHPSIRWFVIIPFMVNISLFGTAFYYLLGQIDPLVNWFTDALPDWLSFLKDAMAFIVWPMAVFTILVFSAFIFGTIANWIAAPFNGLLAERVENLLTGQSLPDGGIMDILKDIPRTLSREFTKLSYYLPRALGFFIIFMLLPVIGQVVWFLFTAWMMAIQYCDYPYDNHKISFGQMRKQLSNHKSHSFSFGIIVTFFSMMPIANLIVMPVAICGATKMWVEELKTDALLAQARQMSNS